MNFAVQLASGRMPGVTVDLDRVVALTDDHAALIAGIDKALLCGGMTAHTRATILKELTDVPDRRRLAHSPSVSRSAARNFSGNNSRHEAVVRNRSITMSISRRAFMKAGGLALFSLGADPIFLDRAAYALTSRDGTAARKLWSACFSAGRSMACR